MFTHFLPFPNTPFPSRLSLPFPSSVHVSAREREIAESLHCMNNMTEVQGMMCLSDKYMIFNGKLLHKKAILRKGTPKPAHAALIAGTTEDKLGQKDADHIISRMKELRTNFRSRVVHHVKSRWVDSAINAKMKFSKTGCQQF